MAFSHADADVAAAVAGLGQSESRRLASDIFYAAKIYENAAASSAPRKSKVKQELEGLLKLAVIAGHRRSRAAAIEMERYARKMSRSAWLQCFSEPDELSTILNEAFATHPDESLQSISRKKDYSRRANKVQRIAEDALDVLSTDRGGKPADRPVRILMGQLVRIYENYSCCLAHINLDEERVPSNTFTQMATYVGKYVDPAIGQAKAIDYLKEALGYASHPPR